MPPRSGSGEDLEEALGVNVDLHGNGTALLGAGGKHRAQEGLEVRIAPPWTSRRKRWRPRMSANGASAGPRIEIPATEGAAALSPGHGLPHPPGCRPKR